ncbi:MAG: hypothetical protein AB1295_04110 [Candidatus Micrarchaeota archaeon]
MISKRMRKGIPTDTQTPASTMKTGIRRDPAIDRLAAAALLRRPMDFIQYREYLSRFVMVTPAAITELDFKALSRNIRAVAHVQLSSQEADVIFTRSSAFMVFRGLPDFSHLNGLVPGTNFSNRSILAVSKEEKVCVVQMDSAELAAVLALSTLSMPEKAGEEARGVPKEAMPIGEKTLQDVAELKSRLLRWGVEYTDPGFDLRAFIHAIAVCREFDNGNYSKCYVVALQDDRVYSISYDKPWKRLQQGAKEFEPDKESKPLCWLNDNGKLYMIREEQFIKDSD